MAHVEVDGARLWVETVGRGPTALVLHGGLGVDHQMYRGLDPLADELRLVYYDHRGNGRSTGDVGTATMEQWADDAVALADTVASGEPVLLVGHSFGGFIAQEAAIRRGERLSGVVLVTTTPGQLGTGEEPAPEGPPMPEEFAELLATMPDTDDALAESMARLAPAYLHQAPVDALLAAMGGTVFRAGAMARGFEELARWSAVDRLAEVEVPVLLVAGRHDGFTAWPQSERIAGRLPDAELVVLEHSGHLPWIDEPDRFFEVVRDWLRRRSLTS